VTRSTGAAGSAVAIASSTGPGTTYPMTTVAYYPAGVVTGAYASGGLFYVINVTQAASTTLYCQYTTAIGLYYWNTTSGTGVWSPSGLSTGSANGAISAWGGTLGNGYYLQAAIDTSSTTYGASCTTPSSTSSTTYQAASFFANGTANGSTITLGSLEYGYANYFLDKNGTLWFGYATQEKSKASTGSPSVVQGNVYAGYVGKIVGQLFIAFGSVLSTFFAFLSLVLFAIFTF